MTAHDTDLIRRVALERADAARQALEDSGVRRALETAAKAVESLAGGRHYQSAFKLAARTIRALKPE